MSTLFRPDADVASQINCIISDVDGVMTDGQIVFDSHGVETKRFHVRDGLGIKLWMQSGFAFAILTARTSPIVASRATELGIYLVRQGCTDKLAAANEIFELVGCTAQQVCYVGDDLPHIAVVRTVGLSVAPADAATDTRTAANWITRCEGGTGVLREVTERLLRAKNRWEEHLT